MNEKIASLIGFAIRARQIELGLDNIIAKKGAPALIVLCESVSDNTKKSALAYAVKRNARIVQTSGLRLEDITFKTNNKVLAIYNKNLSGEILKNVGIGFLDLAQTQN